MPTFSTPGPISLRVKVAAGDIRIEATTRTDTEVDVQPAKASSKLDVETAEWTRVEHRDGEVVVEAPDGRRRTGSIRVRVGLPEGSSLHAGIASADLQARGTLGEVDVSTASGDVRLETVGALSVKTASGDVFAKHVGGDARVTAASGDVRIDTIEGTANVSTASGDAMLGEVRGDLGVNSASGDIKVGPVGGSVEASTASGDLQVGRVSRGTVTAKSTSGDVEVGVASGTAAWLELSSLSGDVRSALDDTDDPGDGETVEIRAKTLSGDIRMKRAG